MKSFLIIFLATTVFVAVISEEPFTCCLGSSHCTCKCVLIEECRGETCPNKPCTPPYVLCCKPNRFGIN
ncbi:hypothetical protein RN001_005384 [Aquatica leii]|uniref:Uncharacterized protein n=1 Tax=Aquatica leii TaxID=1421715 RepID=A0AAN7Q6U4_9COLE|nr:hypothetical protein RN001_005384 [Aquatica leii]